MDRKRQSNRKVVSWKKDQGYLLMSTLFFLLFSGLFSHTVIKISGYQIAQYRQFSQAYKIKAALNMSEALLKEYIEENKKWPEAGQIKTSIGKVGVKKVGDTSYRITLASKNELPFLKEVRFKAEEAKETPEKTENEMPLLHPEQTEEKETNAKEMYEEESAAESAVEEEETEELPD